MVNGSRNWCGTLQLEDETYDAETWFQKLLNDGLVKFVIGQIERGHETEHAHLQFYIQLSGRKTLTQLKKLVNASAHWEPARGSPDQCIEYCSKEDTRVAGPWQAGQPLYPGHRSDLDRAAEMIDNGASLREVAGECKATFIRYHAGLKAYMNLMKAGQPRDLMKDGPEVWVFWGATGTGKSHRAFTSWPGAYRKITSDKWWDGYHGQETVIFDDFKGSSMKLHDFQLVIDKYPLDVEVKGGVIPLSATRYVFTSNKHPREWYSENADPDGSVMRRINEFCADRGRLIHMLGHWKGQGEAEVTGNTKTVTLASTE
ncbi:replication-associated protein [Northern red-backed vole stool-associated circular virus 117]|uniref:Replication-associated protein n=1 Tax=Northern red-backed vole stool-associated circular virus 117 TaxID=2714166 RepID=A0AAE6X468_9VIRU|nr:replication-associated protein [Northern red-backed vole stool-associated circular virus 117]QIK03941.1 replication-associated protein [Northern red-backed vole stool-associated circular virus 117]